MRIGACLYAGVVAANGMASILPGETDVYEARDEKTTCPEDLVGAEKLPPSCDALAETMDHASDVQNTVALVTFTYGSIGALAASVAIEHKARTHP